ncbi:FtsX-like permease family protein [Maribellus comscasis]|uniref:FtsX-like permease family protein n=1 Tax=Maribellus comscasis TaxID=2681766 RepID=A0A6I6JIF5_9BACT|nr:FtsX-like permease family protein [Maribellus comscasis]QGY42526.1 FtsX-like permease family protein [Maribellus comscasis]
MIKFLLKGLIRDKSRSRLPIIIVSIGVMLTVFMHAYINGFMGDTIELNARFTHGHLKVMTKAYADNMNQIPNDLALLEVDELVADLNKEYPEIKWTPRIQFGGLVDAPDENGETKAQGPAMGLGIDFLSGHSGEADRLDIENALVRGNLIQHPGEALLSELFSEKLGVNPGDEVTLIGSTMNGSMTMYNFKVAGTVTFGAEALDRGAIIVDLEDARNALDMQNAAGELIGFLPEGLYNDDEAFQIAETFNNKYQDDADEYAPVMRTLSQQGSMGQYVALSKGWTVYISAIFIFAMALVLWNAGLLGGLRRYGEFGVRLAMGEEKSHVYRTLIFESVFIGIAGTVVGTIFGLFFAWLLQTYGIDISGMMQGGALMMPSTIRARITPVDYYVGLIPGLISTVLGTMLAGIGIYKRKTAQLFKELEA